MSSKFKKAISMFNSGITAADRPTENALEALAKRTGNPKYASMGVPIVTTAKVVKDTHGLLQTPLTDAQYNRISANINVPRDEIMGDNVTKFSAGRKRKGKSRKTNKKNKKRTKRNNKNKRTKRNKK